MSAGSRSRWESFSNTFLLANLLNEKKVFLSFQSFLLKAGSQYSSRLMYSESAWCPDTAYIVSDSEVVNSDGDLMMSENDNEDKFTSEGCCHGRDRQSTRKEGQQHSLKVARFRISHVFNQQGGVNTLRPKNGKVALFLVLSGKHRKNCECCPVSLLIVR